MKGKKQGVAYHDKIDEFLASRQLETGGSSLDTLHPLYSDNNHPNPYFHSVLSPF